MTTAALLLAAVCAASLAGAGAAPVRIAVLRDSSLDCAGEQDALVLALQTRLLSSQQLSSTARTNTAAAAFTWASISPAQLADPSAFNASAFDALLLGAAHQLPHAAAYSYSAFARAGGDLLLLGGKPPRLNTSDPAHIGLNLGSFYEPYVVHGDAMALRVPAAVARLLRRGGGGHSADGAAAAAPPPALSLRGHSAMGWWFPAENDFLPLLEAVDGYNRTAGRYALSLVDNNRGGAYAGGRWLFSALQACGLDSGNATGGRGSGADSIFAQPLFVDTLAAAIAALAPDESFAQQSGVSAAAAAFRATTRHNAAPHPAAPPTHLTSPGNNSSTSSTSNTSSRFVHKTADGRHLLLPGGARYFLLGGDYFRGGLNDSLSAAQLRLDLGNAAWAGLNTVRVYGLAAALLAPNSTGDPADDLPGPGGSKTMLSVFRSFEASHGLRVLFTLACYKDMPAQGSVAGVRAAAVAQTATLRNESWVMGYDL